MPSIKLQRATSEHHERSVSNLWRYTGVPVSAVLLIEFGCFREVFVRAAGEEVFKILVVLAFAAFLLSLIASGLRNIFQD